MRRPNTVKSQSGIEARLSKPIKRLDPFPVILHRILSDARFSDFISWQPHGCSWKIVNRHRFVDEVIPMFFNQTKFESFLRQVNGWGFIRITKGADKGSYYHKSFLRGKSQLAVTIDRPADFKAILDSVVDPPVFGNQFSNERPSQPDSENELMGITDETNRTSLGSNVKSINPHSHEVNTTVRTIDITQTAIWLRNRVSNAMLCSLIEHRQRRIMALIWLEESRMLMRSSPQMLPNMFLNRFASNQSLLGRNNL